jgi:hypothetical protein
MYDRLWAPHGLVRYGVAPDHPEVKVRRHQFIFNTFAEVYDCPPIRIARINLTLLPLTLVSDSSAT